jgi:CheY-like chemotaxis protein
MILVVEDSLDMQLLIRLAFRDEGYEIQIANNGSEALKIIEAGEFPNLILLDSTMEVMGGDEFLRALERRYQDRKFPVVVMSGMDEPLQSPLIVGHLKKPFDIDHLKSIASKYSKQIAHPEADKTI